MEKEPEVAALIQNTLVGDAIGHSPLLAFVADENMSYIAVSNSVCQVLGYSRDELHQLRVPDIAVDPSAADEYEEMTRDGMRSGTSTLRAKSGELYSFEYHAFETALGGIGRYYVAVGVATARGRTGSP